jgi:4'-phosphopantetheinyl transferase EntD
MNQSQSSDMTEQHRVSEVIAALRHFTREGVVVEGGDLEPHGEELFPDEFVLVEKAVTVRQREFRAGRVYVRKALNQLGLSGVPIGRRTQRDPVWPSGIVGSITHNRWMCAVAVARSASVRALGIDIEDDQPIDIDCAAYVTSVREMRWRTEFESLRSKDLPKTLFAIKESVFKAYYPSTRAFLDFCDIEVELELRGDRFCASLVNDYKPSFRGIRSFEGRYGFAGGAIAVYVDAL